MHTDRRDDRVRLRVNHVDVIRSAVDDVYLVLLAVSGDPGGFAAHVQGLRQPEIAQINHADGVALAVGDVGKLAECGTILGKRLLAKIPPSQSAEDGQQHSDEEELSQGS